MYREGKGVAQDDKQAMIWLQKAGEQGNTIAQFSLGKMYFMGEGVAQDSRQAYAWFSTAVANGDTYAAEWRDGVADRLTPAALTEAKQLAASYVQRYQLK